MIASEEQLILIILQGEKRARKHEDDDRFPYPYVFKPPSPPDDLAMTGQVQVLKPLKEKESETEVICQYCGKALNEEEQFTHSCKKKPKDT